MLPTAELTASVRSPAARTPAPRTTSLTLEPTTRLPPLPPLFFAAFAMFESISLEAVWKTWRPRPSKRAEGPRRDAGNRFPIAYPAGEPGETYHAHARRKTILFVRFRLESGR